MKDVTFTWNVKPFKRKILCVFENYLIKYTYKFININCFIVIKGAVATLDEHITKKAASNASITCTCSKFVGLRRWLN